jgi:hypothetical protein
LLGDLAPCRESAASCLLAHPAVIPPLRLIALQILAFPFTNDRSVN